MTDLVTLEGVAALGRLHAAWAHVLERGAAPGVDWLTVEAFARDAPARLQRLHHALSTEAWSPKPARRIQLPDDPERRIAIPSVEDRVVQRAIASALYPLYEARFSPSAWAYRPGRSMHTLIEGVQGTITAGARWYVRTDIEKFFDRLDREYLLELIAADGVERRVVALIERILNAGIYQGAHVFDPGRGAIQGSSLSPLLSNIFLDDVDHALDREDVFYARYADDILVLAEGEAQARRALDQISALVEGLELRLNAKKTQRGDIRDGMTFLGVRFDHAGRGFSERAHLALAEKMRARWGTTSTRWRGSRTLGCGGTGRRVPPTSANCTSWQASRTPSAINLRSSTPSRRTARGW